MSLTRDKMLLPEKSCQNSCVNMTDGSHSRVRCFRRCTVVAAVFNAPEEPTKVVAVVGGPAAIQGCMDARQHAVLWQLTHPERRATGGLKHRSSLPKCCSFAEASGYKYGQNVGFHLNGKKKKHVISSNKYRV